MCAFVDYLDSDISIEDRLQKAFEDLCVSKEQQEKVLVFLNLLKVKDLATYEHSVRVGILAYNIARFIHLEGRALFYAGLLHDVGKAQTDLKVLKKTEGWTAEDMAEIEKHVVDGYRLIRGCFDFSAEIILWHHRFQIKGYPVEFPKLLHEHSAGIKMMIALYGRILALADCFDALHRVNEKFWNGEVFSGEKVKEKMLKLNSDQEILIKELYDEGTLPLK